MQVLLIIVFIRTLFPSQNVEETVNYLDTELSSLLDIIEAPKWSTLLLPGPTVMDIFEKGMCD
uniref:Uncharacterized protein n=1 Tax=Callorhinchus milii TaxID=7868 RepID=A0A4W3I1V1_CALMI